MDEAVPRGLLQNELEVVLGPDAAVVVPNPPEFDGLALERLDEHMVDLFGDRPRPLGSQMSTVAPEVA